MTKKITCKNCKKIARDSAGRMASKCYCNLTNFLGEKKKFLTTMALVEKASHKLSQTEKICFGFDWKLRVCLQFLFTKHLKCKQTQFCLLIEGEKTDKWLKKWNNLWNSRDSKVGTANKGKTWIAHSVELSYFSHL